MPQPHPGWPHPFLPRLLHLHLNCCACFPDLTLTHPPRCLQGSSRAIVLERKSGIFPLLKTLWWSHLKDRTRGPQGSIPCSPTLDLGHASPIPCHTYPVFQQSELLLASKGSRLLHASLLCWECLSALSAPPAHSCLSFHTQLNITNSRKPPLGPHPSLYLGLSAIMSWSILVSSVEVSLPGCELPGGQEPFLFSLGSLAPNTVLAKQAFDQ